MVAEDLLDGGGLLAVVRLRRRAVCVDVLDLRRFHAGLVQGHLHRARVALALRRRRRDVIGVCRRAITNDLAVDLRFAGERAFALLEDEHRGAFREDEAVTILVERPRRLLGRVVAAAHRVHRRERADRER